MDDWEEDDRAMSVQEYMAYNSARNTIAETVRLIHEHIQPPDGEDASRYLARMSSEVDDVLESENVQKDKLIHLLRDTDAMEGRLGFSLAMADTLLERGEPWAATYVLARELHLTYITGAWRPHAIVRKRTSKGGMRAAVTNKRAVAERNQAIRDAYNKMTKPKRDRAAILANRFGVSASQIRRIIANK